MVVKIRKFLFLFFIPLIIALLSIAVYHVIPIIDLFTAFLLGLVVAKYIEHDFIYDNYQNYYLYFLLPLGLFFYGSQINLVFLLKQQLIVSFIVTGIIILYFLLIIPINRFIFHVSNRKLNYILAGANAVCGITATIAFIPFTNAKEEEIVPVVIAIFIAGFISSLLFICLNTYLDINVGSKTILASTTINNTGAVFFAVEKLNKHLIYYALAIKGLRVSALIPISLFMMCLFASKNEKITRDVYEHFNRSILYALTLTFIIAFSAVLFTFVIGFHREMALLYRIIFCMVLAGIGMSCKLNRVLYKTILICVISSLASWFIVVAFVYICLKLFY